MKLKDFLESIHSLPLLSGSLSKERRRRGLLLALIFTIYGCTSTTEKQAPDERIANSAFDTPSQIDELLGSEYCNDFRQALRYGDDRASATEQYFKCKAAYVELPAHFAFGQSVVDRIGISELTENPIDPDDWEWGLKNIRPIFDCLRENDMEVMFDSVHVYHNHPQADHILFATPENNLSRWDDGFKPPSSGTIFINLRELRQVHEDFSWGSEFAMIAMLGHEFTHLNQFVMYGVLNLLDNRKGVEAQADFMGGWLLGYAERMGCIPDLDPRTPEGPPRFKSIPELGLDFSDASPVDIVDVALYFTQYGSSSSGEVVHYLTNFERGAAVFAGYLVAVEQRLHTTEDLLELADYLGAGDSQGANLLRGALAYSAIARGLADEDIEEYFNLHSRLPDMAKNSFMLNFGDKEMVVWEDGGSDFYIDYEAVSRDYAEKSEILSSIISSRRDAMQ